MEVSRIDYNGIRLGYNILTYTLVNQARCSGLSCLPELRCRPCDSDLPFDVAELVASTYDNWSWYDYSDGASKEFLGTYILNVEGLTKSVRERKVSSGPFGPYGERCVTNEREFVVSGLMFAKSTVGMEFGRRWLENALWNKSCDCDSEKRLVMRTDCDDNNPVAVVEYQNVIPIAGPVFEKFFESGRCCELVSRFEFTITALDSYRYEIDDVFVGEDSFDVNNPRCQSWECPVEEHVCGPECCVSCAATSLPGLVDTYTNCCYCRPTVTVNKCFTVPAPEAGVEFGFNLEVSAGSSVLENFSVSVLSHCPAVVDCGDVDPDPPEVLYVYEFNRVPAGVTVTVDGRKRRVSASCDSDGCVSSPDWVYSAGGLPHRWRMFDRQVCVCVEGDWGTVAEDASFKLSLVKRRL